MASSRNIPSPQAGDHETTDIGNLLLQRGKIDGAELNRARRLAEESGDPLHTLLSRLGLVSERDLAAALAELNGLPLIDASEFPEVPILEDRIAIRFMKENRILPLHLQDGNLVAAVADPERPYVAAALQAAAGHPVTLRVGVAAEIDDAIERLYGEGRSAMGEIAGGLEEVDGGEEEDVEHLKDLASEAPVIRVVNLIIQRAVESRASDIHVEPFENRLKVRYRIDGVLREVEAPPAHSSAAVISRIKIMSKLNIAERRLPQDGRIGVRIQGKELDLRVSTVPTLFGESVVIRLLDKESVKFDFAALGYDGITVERLKHILDMPHGIVVVTGPTGSGKSTTLYTALHRLNTAERKIMTVEDPVEYQLDGINQIQVKPQIGLNFANALRAIVRQDPDIIMVGEMRDAETVRIAVQSALTGHLVLSTLHTNDAAGAITRLLDMGVEDYLLTSTINGVVGQRLVRRLCEHCKQPKEVLPELVNELDLTRDLPPGTTPQLFDARGCEHCSGTGYRGRLALAEVLVMSNELRALVMRHADATELQRQAIAEGMQTMYREGLRKCAAGLTTLDDVLRVCEPD
ncbi:MAG: type II secretion system ATPase GspE [Chromatiaceae bacterium]|nr:type II secretion system ATPase GspE [Gammaproteobacteria bacterium]MCP5305426.1 type II secretion system ATPase GspE [Chromatiaceae bacterium]MCP5315385.1 type II secretion system ATPase GspE [Chromatiaceae bacterium]